MGEPKRSLTLIGTGRLAVGLGRLWSNLGPLRIADVMGRSWSSAEAAVHAIGAGRAVDRYERLEVADLFLIATPDGAIAEVAESLAQSGRVSNNAIIFHCSGALSSGELRALRPTGAALGSVHPLTSFGRDPPTRAQFEGVGCAVEGDERAKSALSDLFRVIGGQTFCLAAEQKILYHAAAVFGSNFVVTLLGAAMQTYGLAGIEPEQAARLLLPLVQQTVENVFRTNPRAALTGPIARGDDAVVRRHHAALSERDAGMAAFYRALTRQTALLVDRPDPLTNAGDP